MTVSKRKGRKLTGNVDLLHGNIMWALLMFSIPMLISNFFQQMYSTVDTILVGNILGETSLAAVGASSPINGLIIGFALGIGRGLAIVTARSYGAGDHELMKKSVANVIMIGAGVTVIVTILALILIHPVLVVLRTPAEVLVEAEQYITVIVWFLGVSMMYNLCSGLLRAIGNSVMPLLFLILSSVLNIILDYVLIAHVGMGVRGAAVATVISQFLSAICSILYLMKACPILIPRREHFCFDKELFVEMIEQGLSVGLMGSIVSLSSVILQYGINGLGTLMIAAHTIARKVYIFCNMPFMALGASMSSFVPQNKGADQPERIREAVKLVIVYNVVMAVIMTVFLQFFATDIVRLLSGSAEPVVLENATRYLKVVAPFYAVLGALNALRGSCQGIGMKKLPLVSSVIELIGKTVFVVALIPLFGYQAVIFCEPVIWCVMVAQLAWAFYGNPYIKNAKQRAAV